MCRQYTAKVVGSRSRDDVVIVSSELRPAGQIRRDCLPGGSNAPEGDWSIDLPRRTLIRCGPCPRVLLSASAYPRSKEDDRRKSGRSSDKSWPA